MSVSFYKLIPEMVFLGGSIEANWLVEHMEHDDVNSSCTKVYVDEERIQQAVKSARACEKKGVCNMSGYVCLDPEDLLKAHRKATRELPKALRAILKKMPDQEHAWFDLEISW